MKIIEDLIIFTCNRFVTVEAYSLTKWRLPVTLMPCCIINWFNIFVFFIVLYFVSGEKLFYDHIIINIGINTLYLSYL